MSSISLNYIPIHSMSKETILKQLESRSVLRSIYTSAAKQAEKQFEQKNMKNVEKKSERGLVSMLKDGIITYYI